jgi:glycine cleavage system aminomethyltransferase T
MIVAIDGDKSHGERYTMNDPKHFHAPVTVRMSSRRFERSPFQDRWDTPETVMGVYAGRYYSAFNGEDVEAVYWALRRNAVMYDVPERPVEISGPDAARFLERTLARRVHNLMEGRGRYALACTHQGHLFMDGVLFKLGEDRFWYVQPDGALETWLIAHSEGFDVSITDPKSRVLQIQGPRSFDIIKQASAGAIDERMGYFHSGFFDLGGQEVYVSRTGWTGELGFEVYTQGNSTDCGRLWDHLLQAGTPHGMVFGSLASMAIRRIEAGILDNGTDFDLTMTPFEAGLGAFVDLEKPDFIGRAALLKAHRNPRIFGLKCPAAAPDYRAPITDGQTVVGHVTAGAWSPYLNVGVGYARFTAAGNWVGRRLLIKTAVGGSVDCEIIELPFYDRDKQIPKGLCDDIP